MSAGRRLIGSAVPGGLAGRGFHKHIVGPNPGDTCQRLREEPRRDFERTQAAVRHDPEAVTWLEAHKDLWS